MHPIKFLGAAVMTLTTLSGCTQVTAPRHIAGHWECDNYTLDLTDDGHYSVYSILGKTRYEGTFTVKPDAKGDTTEIVAEPKVYPLSDYKILVSKPVSEFWVSTGGLMLYRVPGGEFMQCHAPHNQ